MKRRAALLVTGMAAAATMAMAPPAAAQTLCFGPTSMFICVNPTGGTPIQECVYAGPPPCHPVSVPTPWWGCGGALYCRSPF